MGPGAPAAGQPADAQEAMRRFREAASPYASPFKVLGVDTEAPQEVVKAAYRSLSRKYHPDGGKEPNLEKTKAINAAYEEICKVKGWGK